MSSPHQVTAEINLSLSSEVAHAMIESLKPELTTPTSDRSAVFINTTTNGILIKIEAEDVAALRSAVNSYLYWAKTIIEIYSKIN